MLRRQGFHFRRQARIGPYIADLACKSARLVIELDGGHHAEAANVVRDEARTAFLTSRGYTVLRFWNHEVFEDRDHVVEAVLHALGPTRPAPRSDLPVPGR